VSGGDGCSIEAWVNRLQALAANDDFIRCFVIGVDADGKRRVIFGQWDRGLLAESSTDPEAQGLMGVAMVTSLGDRYGLRAGA
jgi:hypothetical protein